jgi:acetyl esterase/lipase
MALAAACAVAICGASAALAQQAGAPARPTFSADGTAHVPAFDLPPSSYISAEALAMQKARANMPSAPALGGNVPIQAMRAGMEARLAPQVAEMRSRYEVDIAPQVIAGVNTRIITPRAGEANRRRVLINLHGGAFSMCEDACALLESVPIAALGRYRVVTVAYRQGPEHAFPAASEDVAAVYRELLRTYRPENIGIYGCSAGGVLTGQAAAWLQRENLPNPGAIGIFGAGAGRFGAGDSAYIAGYIDGSFAPPRAGATPPPDGYFRGANMDDPLVSPTQHPDVMARFPPALIITGTRATDMSPAIVTHTELVKAGVDSQLIVGEGMGHCYIYQSNLPEARDAYNIIVRFFNEHLGVRRR